MFVAGCGGTAGTAAQQSATTTEKSSGETSTGATSTTTSSTTTTVPTTEAPSTTVATTEPATTTSTTTTTTTTSTAVDPTAPSEASPFGEDFALAPEPTTWPGRPAWYDTRALPADEDNIGIAQPTPPELENRAFASVDRLPAPIRPEWFVDIRPVPAEVAARSTWSEGCPVTLDDLRYLRVSHWGFEGKVHTGELIVAASVADDVASVFHELFNAKFPLEDLYVSDMSALDTSIPPTGDGNGSGAFVCRAAKKSTRWSDHALGTAIDLDPFQNPYKKGDVVIPELASSYLDRTNERPGMIVRGGPVVAAFERIGWGWGGEWNSLKDYMHFSLSGK